MNRLPKKILAPVDFSEASTYAFDYALDLAETIGATVYALNTYDLPIIGLPDGVVVATPAIAGRIIETATKGLADVCARAKGRKVDVVSLLKQGDPRDVILATAKDVGAELVVIGTHGRRGIARAVLGSVAESVVRASPVPVLTMHLAAPPVRS